jgi:hypothetical protein
VPEPAGERPGAGDVSDLRRHIDAAHAAADRLVQEAHERAQAADRAFRERLGDVPDRGWAVGAEHRPPPSGPSELQLVLRLLEAVRDALPPELTAQLAEAVRELLLAVRALIDWYLDRLEQAARPGKGGGGERVEDIPIV